MLGCIDDIHKDPSHASFSSYISTPTPAPPFANDSLALLKSDFMKRDASARHVSILVTCFTSEPGGNVQNVFSFLFFFFYENLMDSQRCIPLSLLPISRAYYEAVVQIFSCLFYISLFLHICREHRCIIFV